MINKQKKKILIVDDEFINYQIISSILESKYFVFIAETGKSAIDSAKINKPDLILLDILMPGMDGFETCRKLKSDKQTSNIPIIFLTCKNKDEDEAKGLSYGAVDYFRKPFRPTVDMQRISLHIKLSEQRKSVQTSNKMPNELIPIQKFFGLENEIKELFQFTDAEARLCYGLINGRTLGEISKSSKVAYSTLRGYLRNIFYKTNTKKQHELVSTIMTALILWIQAEK
ncbi:MAG: response regulator [Pseudomonadota bacterium]